MKHVDTSILKRLISGEPFSIERKKSSNYSFKPISSKKDEKINTFWKPYATMLLSVNEVIDFKETGISITDRCIVVPFNATFTDSKGNRDINICEKLCQDLPLQIIATRSIFELFNVLENGQFTIPDIVQEETDRYFLECNNALEFCKRYPIEAFIPISQYYEEYCIWTRENNFETISNSQFRKSG